MLIQEALKSGERSLQAAGIESSRLDALLLLEQALAVSREQILANPHKQLNPRQQKQFMTLLKRRSDHVPLAYLTGVKEFYGLEFKVNPEVLVPRPETENLVEYAAAKAPRGGRFLDIGTGSGAIAVAVKHVRGDLSVTASDISPPALKLARVNAQQAGVEVEFIESDLFKAVTGRFGFIAANLPYLEPRPRQISLATKYEPRQALYGGGSDGLAIYRRFFTELTQYLDKGALVALEANPWQHQTLVDLAAQAGLGLRHREKFMVVFVDGAS